MSILREKLNMQRPILHLIASIGNLAGLGTIVALIVVYGSMPKSLADNIETTAFINKYGSISSQRHEALDDQRIKNIERRLDLLEANSVNIIKIQIDVEWIKRALGGGKP